MIARTFVRTTLLMAVLLSVAGLASSDAPPAGSPLAGIWGGKRLFGPDVRGPLQVTRAGGTWRAQIGPYDVQPTLRDGRLAFELPQGQGRFTGKLEQGETVIRGQWKQGRTTNGGQLMSPILLRARAKDRWVGEVVPMDAEWTVYLVVTPQPDGSLSAFIRNPDRNVGIFWPLEGVELQGDRVSLACKPPCQGNARFAGTFDAEGKRLTVDFPSRGGTYDLVPAGDEEIPGFYARGKNAPPWRYAPPMPGDDGWRVGTLAEVGMTSEPLAELVRTISEPPASVHDPDIHAVLIARHGKLVVEEYFHGYHRYKAHDTRSATKGIAAMMIGAVIEHGGKLKVTDRVYDLVYDSHPPADLDPRKAEMTVEHLLTMSSGYDCDDWADTQRPGSEDSLSEQPDQDYYRYTLQLPMESKPGEVSAYCSVNANLLGAVLRAATGKPVTELFYELLAEPLQMSRYYQGSQPTGEAYLAGAMYFLPRDFLKFGQVMLDGGVWDGKRILGKDFVRRASSSLVTLRGQAPNMHFGYLWWTTEYDYDGRKVHAYFASGNGGQEVVVVPELDLVIATYGGSYNDKGGWVMIKDYIPRFILPAVKGAASAGAAR